MTTMPMLTMAMILTTMLLAFMAAFMTLQRRGGLPIQDAHEKTLAEFEDGGEA